MARQSKVATRAARRREDAAFKFLAAGAALVILPLVLRASPLGKGFSTIIPLGFLMLAVGGLLLFLVRQRAQSGVPGISAIQDIPLQSPNIETSEAAAIDRAITEFARAGKDAKGAQEAPSAKPISWGQEVFSVIEWRRFEAVVEALFRQAGLETKSQSHGADGGVDVWLYSRQKPGIPVGLVQCKHWQGKQVGVDKIRELRGVMAAQKAERGIFATTSNFSRDATAFARGNGIDLLDVDRLLSLIAKRTPEQQQALLEVALEGEYWRPTCASCGTKMVKRTPRKGGSAFWGCTTYPACKATLPMRNA